MLNPGLVGAQEMGYVFHSEDKHASRIMSSQVIEVAAVVPATSFHTVREGGSVEDD